MKAVLFFLFAVAWPIQYSAHALRLSFETCSEFGGKKVVLVNLNKNYMTTGIFYNWYHYAQPFLDEANAQLVIDISHEDSEHLLKMPELSDHHALMYPDGSLSTISVIRTHGPPNADLFKQPFAELMTHRVVAIKRLIEKGCTVMQVDTDTVWRANPFEDIKDPEAKTLVVTDDARNHPTNHWSPHLHTHFCGCFIYLTPKLLSAKCNFFEKWSEQTLEAGGNEQAGLNNALHYNCANDVPYEVLPLAWYSDGPRTNFGSAHIIHANYLPNLDAKVRWLKTKQLWHASTEQWLKKTRDA